MTLQFSYFLVSGAIASLMNWGGRFFFSQYFNFQTAVVLAFFIGLSSGFLLMRFFVFKDAKSSSKSQAIWYVVVNMLALAQTFVVSLLMVKLIQSSFESTDTAEAIAHAVGVIVPVFTSFLGHKHFTFR
jgi:putative flippase GtrA